jgi:hypothetical protein
MLLRTSLMLRSALGCASKHATLLAAALQGKAVFRGGDGNP